MRAIHEELFIITGDCVCILPFTIPKCATITVHDIEPKSKPRELVCFVIFLFLHSLSIINIVIVITFIRFHWRRVYFLFPFPLRWNRGGSQTNNTTETMTKKNIYEVIAVVPFASVCVAKLRWVSIEKSHTTHSGNIVRLSFCGYLFIVIVSDGHGIVRGLRARAIKEKWIKWKVLDGHIA